MGLIVSALLHAHTRASKHEGNLPYLQLVLGFNAAVYALHMYLDIRQLRAIKLPLPPKELRGVSDTAEYKKTQAYQTDKWWFSLVQGVYGFLLSSGLLFFMYLPWLWHISTQVVSRLGLSGEITVSVAFFLLDSLKDQLLGIPWSLWNTFIVEQRHGFNKQTPLLFITDQLKQAALSAVLIPPIVAGFTWILLNTGPGLPFALWAFIFAVQIIALTIYPVLIAPLFNKFDPLPPGALREKIEGLASSLKFPLTKLYVVDGSTRSAHSNAYMYGLYKNKRIVLFDTLIEQCSEGQVVAVLAHELGHWKLSHTVQNLVLTQAHLLLSFSLFAAVRTSPALFASFGFRSSRPAIIAFMLFQFISAPLEEVLAFLMNLVSRSFEFQADRFAASLGRAEELRGALLRLDAKNRSAQNVDHLFSLFHHSHPPLVERLAALDGALKQADGGAAAKKAD
ncbi:hypothetical protein WJX81_006463 [Elliptochloris bilobata]|uniref:CAAX prenyl protease n=1 Tax=Elliptochloris bilobata TaxID=381761 RepID=A0AAW1QZT3_9CHLO